MSKLFKGTIAICLSVLVTCLLLLYVQGCAKDGIYTEQKISNVEKKLEIFRDALSSTKIKSKQLFDGNVLYRSEFPDSSIRATLAAEFVQEIAPYAISLIRTYGITDQEIIAEFGSFDSINIVLSALVVLMVEDLINSGQTIDIFEEDDYSYAILGLMGINSSFAQSDTFGGCLADAIGIVGAFEILENGVAGLGKKGVLKVIKKIAGKFLGPFGAAMAAYDFADCMGWI